MPLMIVPSESLVTTEVQYHWIDPTGVTRDFTRQTSPRRHVFAGGQGLGMAPRGIVSDKLPFDEGSLIRHVSVEEVELQIPIFIIEDNYNDLMAAVNTMRKWFRTGNERNRTPGYWNVTLGDGTVRQIACYYKSGLEGDPSSDGPNFRRYICTFIAPSAFWQDASDNLSVFYQGVGSGGWFDTPYIWGSLTPADIFNEILVINNGDEVAYPIWVVHGPVDVIRMYNRTTDKFWQLNIELHDGQYVTVDTRPPSQRSTLPILDVHGSNRRNALEPLSELWTLVKGGNYISIQAGAASPVSSVELSYRARYEGVLG